MDKTRDREKNLKLGNGKYQLTIISKDLIIKIANLKNQNLYWYLNGEYLDKTRDREKNLKLGNGKYQLTIISEEGDMEKINFEILR